jgi:periplasmic divalent cation tolerance protein
MTVAARVFRIALVMTAGEDEAAAIARALVEERLAACVNVVGPARSVYRWHDAIESAAEYMLVIKTRTRDFARLERRVRELHSYEVPEIVAVPLAAGSPPYLEWLAASTATPARAAARSKPRRRAHA